MPRQLWGHELKIANSILDHYKCGWNIQTYNKGGSNETVYCEVHSRRSESLRTTFYLS